MRGWAEWPKPASVITLMLSNSMNKRILIVDDSFYMRTMLKNMLTDAGYEVVGEAANGAQALEMATSTMPDTLRLM